MDFRTKYIADLSIPPSQTLERTVILDKVNKEVIQATNVNQWKNTDSVLEWFNNIEDKHSKFVIFDIVSFYPSITKELLVKAIQFAKTTTDITTSEVNIIMQSRKTLLLHEKEPWVKNLVMRISMSQWDVLMVPKFASLLDPCC